MNIFDTLKTSLELTKNSWYFFKQNKRLILFPALACALYILFFPLAVFLSLHWFDPNTHEISTGQIVPLVAFGVSVLLILSFIATFFNAAAIYYILEHMQLRKISISESIKFAAKRWVRVLQWSVINLFVTQIIALLERNHSTTRTIVANLCGVAWQLATFFVIPFMIMDNIGPLAALKKSGQMFKNRWRRVIGTNFILFIITLAMAGTIVLAAYAFYYTRTFNPVVIILSLVALATVVIRIVVIPLLQTIIRCAIFQMLRNDQAPKGFQIENLQAALIEHKQR